MPYKYPFDKANEDLKLAVWREGQADPKYDSDVYRKDACGHWMRYSDHGNTSSQFGWEIDHIKPTSLGGSDDLRV